MGASANSSAAESPLIKKKMACGTAGRHGGGGGELYSREKFCWREQEVEVEGWWHAIGADSLQLQ